MIVVPEGEPVPQLEELERFEGMVHQGAIKEALASPVVTDDDSFYVAHKNVAPDMEGDDSDENEMESTTPIEYTCSGSFPSCVIFIGFIKTSTLTSCYSSLLDVTMGGKRVGQFYCSAYNLGLAMLRVKHVSDRSSQFKIDGYTIHPIRPAYTNPSHLPPRFDSAEKKE